MNKYIERVIEATKAKNSHEPEFLQTVEEVLSPSSTPTPSMRRPACWSGWSSPSAPSSSA